MEVEGEAETCRQQHALGRHRVVSASPTPAGRSLSRFRVGWRKPNVDPTAFPSDSFTVGAVRAVGPPVKQTPPSRPPTPLIFTILLNSGVGCWTVEGFFSNRSQAEV